MPDAVSPGTLTPVFAWHFVVTEKARQSIEAVPVWAQ
jgi:hypothetical protein